MLLEVLIQVNSLRKIRCISLLSPSRQLVSSTQEHPSLWPKWSWSQLHMGKCRVQLWMSCILLQGSIWAFRGLVTSLSQDTIKVLSMPVLNQEPSVSQTSPTHTELPMILILNFKIRNITEYLQITHGSYTVGGYPLCYWGRWYMLVWHTKNTHTCKFSI